MVVTAVMVKRLRGTVMVVAAVPRVVVVSFVS
jgi:hypothetical protein